MKSNTPSKSINVLLIIALVMVLAGNILASSIQTVGGNSDH